MRVPLAPAVSVGYEINGVGVGTEENMKVLKVCCDRKTLLWTVMMVLVDISPLREAVQE